MTRSEFILYELLSRYTLRQDIERQKRMSAIGLINSRCSVYVVENLAAGEILYNKRGEGWPDVITVIVDRANDNVMISGSVELGREIESF